MNINPKPKPKPIQSDRTPHQIPGLIGWIEHNECLGGFIDVVSGERVFPRERGKDIRMPCIIKLLDLVTIPNTRHLWPDEFEGLIGVWEDTRNNDQLGIIADWLDDHNEPELAHAFRWCYKRNIRMWETRFPAGFYISKDDLPSCLQYTGGINTTSTNVGICVVMACLAGVLTEVREAIA